MGVQYMYASTTGDIYVHMSRTFGGCIQERTTYGGLGSYTSLFLLGSVYCIYTSRKQLVP